MISKEEKVLKIIEDNPTIEQSEIAKLLNIKRSTVAVHISNLQKKGIIKGKGYIINKEDYVLGIGAANIDIYGKSLMKIRTHYDHPAQIVSDVGGVTRNIINNLAKLEIKTKLITAVGNDDNAKVIIEDCKVNGIDTSNILKVNDDATGIFMQVQDENNDMHIALCDMSVLNAITPEYINKNKSLLTSAKIVLIDTSLREDTIEEIIKICKNKTPIYVDPISDKYSLKLIPYIKDFEVIKPNKSELEKISGVKIEKGSDIESACRKLLSKGLKKIFVSLGKDGILYMDNQGNKIRRKLKPISNMINASGAGDASMAAIIYGTLKELNIEKTIDYGLAAGLAAIKSKRAVNENMSVNLLNKILKENKL